MLLTDDEKRQIEKRFETDTDLVSKENMIIKYAVYKTCLMSIEALTPSLKEYVSMQLVV
jgi:hypothetical protein